MDRCDALGGDVDGGALQPGGSMDSFKDGDEIVLTQSSMQLEELIGKYLVGVRVRTMTGGRWVYES